MRMKRFFTAMMAACLIAACQSCSNVCQDPHSPNFNTAGKCMDIASSVTGTYSGTLRDSTSGSSGSSYSVQLSLTKVDNSTVSVKLIWPAGTPFTPFNATVLTSPSGYYLAVKPDGSLTGAAAAYGMSTDGYYTSSTRALGIYVEADTARGSFEAFEGTRQ
jgi:hypothetical protein